LVGKQLSPSQTLDIVADAVLSVDVHRVRKRLRTLVQDWTNIRHEDTRLLSRPQIHRVALATALAACEIEASNARFAGEEPWPPHIERYIRRLVEHGVHELNAYEASRLQPVHGDDDDQTRVIPLESAEERT
jgi:hypothetical protein